MPRTKRGKPGLGQERLLVGDDLPVIPEQYDLARAKELAHRRKARIRRSKPLRERFMKEAELAPDDIRHEEIKKAEMVAEGKLMSGFNKRTSGLFVPTNGTENGTIVNRSIKKLRSDREIAEERVREKYADDPDVSEKQVNAWAFFAGISSVRDNRIQFRTYREGAAVKAAWIYEHLAQPKYGGVITRDAFEYIPDYEIDPQAHKVNSRAVSYKTILRYLMDIESFAVLHPSTLARKPKGEHKEEAESVTGRSKYEYRRGWPVKTHVHKYQERMDRAHQYMEALPDLEFALTVEEALYNFWSRTLYWREDNKYLDKLDREASNAYLEPNFAPIVLQDDYYRIPSE